MAMPSKELFISIGIVVFLFALGLWFLAHGMTHNDISSGLGILAAILMVIGGFVGVLGGIFGK